jgi:hypothetical protein
LNLQIAPKNSGPFSNLLLGRFGREWKSSPSQDPSLFSQLALLGGFNPGNVLNSAHGAVLACFPSFVPVLASESMVL